MNTDAKRYYALLGLDPACTDEEIRGAYRRRAKELHPDAESGDITAFIRLKRAYDTLSDPARRAHYDRVNNPHVRQAIRIAAGPPPVARPRPPRQGGMSFRRYFVAFLFMGGLSFGAIETMISYADVPSAAPSHPLSLIAGAIKDTAAKEEPAPRAKSSVGPGFWDSSNPTGAAANDEPPAKHTSVIGALPE